MLTAKEGTVKEIMEERFIPALHSFLERSNPAEYKKWQGNACRQTAVFAVPILEALLPDYKWTAWDGDFEDIVYGREVTYNHAWVYGVNRKEGRRLLVDLSRIHHERLFIEVDSNKYPKDHPSYIHMKELRRKEMDVQEMLDDTEYYSRKPSRDILEYLVEEMGK
jgi:hypothetical protein